ncbi:MAG TPA: hypothetical protein VFO27_09615 [Bryobacteraceae bacterium]|nr:hypothetical protein [Bryobacteraceae bacterium]
MNWIRQLYYNVHGHYPPLPARRKNPSIDLPYRDFVREHPCAVCGIQHTIEFAHTGPRGLRQKAPDKDGVPLCHHHHQSGNHSLHKIGPLKFQSFYRISFVAIRRGLRLEWQQKLHEAQQQANPQRLHAAAPPHFEQAAGCPAASGIPQGITDPGGGGTGMENTCRSLTQTETESTTEPPGQ